MIEQFEAFPGTLVQQHLGHNLVSTRVMKTASLLLNLSWAKASLWHSCFLAHGSKSCLFPYTMAIRMSNAEGQVPSCNAPIELNEEYIMALNQAA